MDQTDRGGVDVCYSAAWQPSPWAVVIDGTPVLFTTSRVEAHRLAKQARGPEVVLR